MSIDTATLNNLPHDCVRKTPAQILARYQQRIYEHRASYNLRAENVIMRGEDPQLVELREGGTVYAGPFLFVTRGRRSLSNAPILWRIRSVSTPHSRSGRLWRLEVDEVDTILDYLRRVAQHIQAHA